MQKYIKNISGSPFKIPFRLDTPYEIKAKVKGVIEAGKRKFIPEDVAMYLDTDRLEMFERRREIKVTEKKIIAPRMAIKPQEGMRRIKPPKEDKVQVKKDKEDKNVEKGGS